MGEQRDKELCPTSHAHTNKVVLIWILLGSCECLGITYGEGANGTAFAVRKLADEFRKVTKRKVLSNVVVDRSAIAELRHHRSCIAPQAIVEIKHSSMPDLRVCLHGGWGVRTHRGRR